MRRFRIPFLCLLAASCLLLICCPADDDDDATGDDDVTGDDDTTTGADDDDATGDDDDDSFVPEQIDGYVQVQFNEGPDNAGGIASQGLIWANFFEEISEPVPGYTENQPDGTDQCAVTSYSATDIQNGDPGEFTYQAVGEMTVSTGGSSWTLTPVDPGTGYIFYQWPLNTQTDLVFDAAYDASADGDTFPAFDVTSAIQMPSAMHLTSPTSAEMVTLTGDVSVQWSGGGSPDITLKVHAINGIDYTDIICTVANDGEFTIPASYTSQLPGGTVAELTLTQKMPNYVEVDSRWVEFAAAISLSADGTVP